MHRLINDLSLEQKKELSAIVWLGRGDYDSFEDAMENADSVVGDGQGTAGYLEGTDLAANISRGIDKLKAEDISLI